MSRKKIRVLVLDDEKMIAKMLRGCLLDEGFLVETASTGKEGLRLFSQEKFDAAIIDIRLPDMDGDDVIIQAHAIQPETKFLIHTGSLDYAPSEDLSSIGIRHEAIIHKPMLDIKEISRLIRKEIKKKR
jgi:DNA-binding response OmpR family regulator